MFGTTCRPHFRVPDETSKTGYRCAYCAKEVRPNRNSTMKPLEIPHEIRWTLRMRAANCDAKVA